VRAAVDRRGVQEEAQGRDVGLLRAREQEVRLRERVFLEALDEAFRRHVRVEPQERVEEVLLGPGRAVDRAAALVPERVERGAQLEARRRCRLLGRLLGVRGGSQQEQEHEDAAHAGRTGARRGGSRRAIAHAHVAPRSAPRGCRLAHPAPV
jgi:hypothetical protein